MILFVLLLESCLLVFAQSETTSSNTTEPIITTQTFEDDEKGVDTFVVVAALFAVLIVLSLTVTLSVGIYKYRRYHIRHGLYKQKSRVGAQEERNASGPDLDMFVVQPRGAGQSEDCVSSRATSREHFEANAGFDAAIPETSGAVPNNVPKECDETTSEHGENIDTNSESALNA
ncbi:hypothetical protein MAR_036189 [Mya arenaria]|uniref:Uncharacterized protein n=1 Tax=Mya arenaria TaxID=6604 RepID=A0ABY7EM97_MYAAR|nr:uncharacterized protein LOC128241668 [Mya arenaria]WAR11113.1 hypothetical protein MAR_036189 [Mya arenaria]